MPVNSYFQNHGNEVMDHLNAEYGPEKGQHVFYAMANKRKNAKPAFLGDLGDPQDSDPTPMPPPPPVNTPNTASPFGGGDPAMSGAMPPVPASGPPPMPTPPPSMPPPPVVNTVSQGIGSNPMYRRGLVSGLEKADEGPGMPNSPQSQIGQGPMAKLASKAGQDYAAASDPSKKTPMWKEALGITLNRLGLPQVGGKLTGDDEKNKLLQRAVNLSSLSDEERKQQTGAETSVNNALKAGSLTEERASFAESRRLNAETRAQNAQIFADRVKAQESKQKQDWLTRELGSKERQEDSTYQKQSDPIQPGYVFYPDPSNPGSGFAAPPSMRNLPTELTKWLPGNKPGDLVAHSDYRKALDMHQKNLIEETKAANKNDPNATLDGQVRTEIAGFGGDVSKKEDVAKGLQLVEAKKAREKQAGDKGTILMLPTEGGGFKATSVKPGDTVAPGAVTPSGMSTTNIPTANTRAMSEKAPRVIQFVDRISQILDANEKQLGPLKSRWSEFTTGRVGLPNQGYTQLRTVKGLLTTALMNMHVGARGGADIMKHFDDLINTSVQDPDNLRAALAEIKAYAESVAKEGSTKADLASPGTTSRIKILKVE